MRKFIKNKKDMTIVKLIDKNGKVFIGRAKVHPDDVDFANSRTGAIIAENRARIKRHEKMVNQRAKEIQDLMKQIRILEDSLCYHSKEIDVRREFEESYLSSKEKFYKQVRKNRKDGRGLNDILESLSKAVDKLEEVKNKED